MKQKKFILPLVVILFFLFIFMGIFSNSFLRNDSGIQHSNNKTIQTTSAKEALTLAYIDAKKVIDEPLFNSIVSTDADETTPSIYAGQNGKRANWNISFGNAEGTKRVDCQVRNGNSKIVYIDEQNSLRKGEYQLADLEIDSSDIIASAIKNKQIKPGNPDIPSDWIKGYHFTIYTAQFAEGYTKLVIEVTGISPDSPDENGDSFLARVFFDAKTGELLSAYKQIGYDSNGRSQWENY